MLSRGQLANPRNLTGLIACFLLFAVLLATNAWIVDDAYITFRSVDNFINGYGLTWNVDERVQVYTHPLWMFVISFFYMITSEMFFTAVIVSALTTLIAALVAWSIITHGFRDSFANGLLFLIAIAASKATMDYASSGLENALSYLLAASFISLFLRFPETTLTNERRLFFMFLLGALAFVNRADTVLLYIPALLYVLYLARQMPPQRLALLVLLGISPAVAWLLFSIIYYGYPFPNTAYAKVISTGFPFAWKVQRGIEYFFNSLLWDTASYAVAAGALVISLKKRSMPHIFVIGGALLYICFVVISAASATHMSGRFFAVPLFITALVFADIADDRRVVFGAITCLLIYMAWSPVSAIKFGTPFYYAYKQNQSYIDTKHYVLNEGAALLNWRPGIKMPDHAWYITGGRLRSATETVFVGGVGGEAIGYVGFAAGPHKHFVDQVALSDPLLSKLPARKPMKIGQWKSGHYHRDIPEGYIASLKSGNNVITDPDIRTYYDHVRTLTRSPIWSAERFDVILNMNLGRYEYLLKPAVIDAPTSVQTPDNPG